MLLYNINNEGEKNFLLDIFGTVDYETGEIKIGYREAVTFHSTDLPGNEIQIRGVPLGQDVVAKKSVYLDLDVDSSKISAVIDTNLLSK